MDPDESERFLDQLNEWACQPPRVYFHQWEVGDAVIWDNRRLMHRGDAVRHDRAPPDVAHPHRRRALLRARPQPPLMRIVVLGAGFGGLELTTRLSDEFGDDVDVVLIDRTESFVFGFSKLEVMFGRDS